MKRSSIKLMAYGWIFLITFLGYTNCSSFESFTPAKITNQLSSSPLITPSTDEKVVADANGKIFMLQDLSMVFEIPGAAMGLEYQVINAPSWLEVNATLGQIKGVPDIAGTYSNIYINIVDSALGVLKKTLGPYTIEVLGNPLKQNQWHLKNTAQNSFSGAVGISGEDIHLTETIKNHYLGKDIRIVVSDTGILESHPSLSSAMESGSSRNYLLDGSSNWVGNSSPTTSSAENAHGTAVAGLIGERGWTNYGGRGVAPLSKLIGFLFIQAQEKLQKKGQLTSALYSQFSGGFDIYNYSWLEPQCSLAEYAEDYSEKLSYGTTNYRKGLGALYVKSAGNSFRDVLSDCYPSVSSDSYFYGNANFSEESTTPYTIIVGAVNADGLSSSYSSPGSNLWISAPGGEYGLSRAFSSSSSSSRQIKPALITTDFIGCALGIKSFSSKYSDFDKGSSPNNYCTHTSTMNGTSGAAPILSGALALILSANPTLSWRDVKHILAFTADKLDPNRASTSHPDSSNNLSGHTYEQGWVTNRAGYHFHNWYGFGRVNVDNAVNMAKNYTSSLGTLKSTNTSLSGSLTKWKYALSNLNFSVPAGISTGVTSSFNVTESLITESVQVQVGAYSCIGNLGIELTSPSGTKSILMNINSLLMDDSMAHKFLSNAFYGENSVGEWTLKLIGGKSGCTSSWEYWGLNILGH
ncbi:MAG: S8 family serine peptidase [Bdellovibrionales bacterium]|nr:S8 family serine peptidase [Bdellovibrionales bacterium]